MYLLTTHIPIYRDGDVRLFDASWHADLLLARERPTAYFAARYPRSKIVAVEPSPANVEALRWNCRAHENVQVLVGGVWPLFGHLRIANPQDAAWSHYCEPADPSQEGAFRSYTLDEIIDASGFGRCDLLKLDVEGAEEQNFRAPGGWLNRVDTIAVEIHGPGALGAVDATCSSTKWHRTPLGEKLVLRHREAFA
jgi:FkbM family methyltransferase